MALPEAKAQEYYTYDDCCAWNQHRRETVCAASPMAESIFYI